jgi:ribosomal protein S10
MEADSFGSPRTSRSVRLRIAGEDHRTVDQAAADVVATARATGCRVTGPPRWTPPPAGATCGS